MKKMNTKGFTLIELLAVIVIMGILMLVAIPAVQRYITQSRKNTYVNTVKEYYNAARTAYAADKINCDSATTCYVTFAQIKDNFLDSGGDSPYGTFNSDSRIIFNIASNGKVTYTIAARDAKNYYINGSPSAINGDSVKVDSSSAISGGTQASIVQ